MTDEKLKECNEVSAMLKDVEAIVEKITAAQPTEQDAKTPEISIRLVINNKEERRMTIPSDSRATKEFMEAMNSLQGKLQFAFNML
jgi:hypothetical protein